MTALGRQIARITFYDSLAVIEKLIGEKQGPYRHLLSGQETAVKDPVDYIAAAPSELIRPWLVGDAAARSIDIKLKDELQLSRREVETMRQDRMRLQTEIATVSSELEAKSSELEARLLQVRSELDAILRSRSWRATALVRKAANLLRRRS